LISGQIISSGITYQQWFITNTAADKTSLIVELKFYQQCFSSRTAADNLSSINTSPSMLIFFLPKLI
jgi:hypothetical protein